MTMIWVGSKQHDMGLATSGVAQGCPLSGTVFVMIVDPILHHMQSALRAERRVWFVCVPMMLKIALRRSASMALLSPVFAEAGKTLGLFLKPTKCVVVPARPGAKEENKDAIRSNLQAAYPAWASFRISSSGLYIGVLLGPGRGRGAGTHRSPSGSSEPASSWQWRPLPSQS